MTDIGFHVNRLLPMICVQCTQCFKYLEKNIYIIGQSIAWLHGLVVQIRNFPP